MSQIEDNKIFHNNLSEIYILLCRSGFNKDYYGYRLHRVQLISIWIDIIIALGTAGTGISALTVWNTDHGKIVWGSLTAASTLSAIIKPVLQFNKKVERLTKLFVGHSEIYSNMIILASRIKRKQELTDEIIAAFESAEQKFLDLSKDDDPYPDEKLSKKCQDAIRMKHPAEDAWFPDGSQAETALSHRKQDPLGPPAACQTPETRNGDL